MSTSLSTPASSAFGDMTESERIKAELDLLRQCSSDTVYRLRYDTMQYDYISPSVENLLGYTVAELMDVNMRSLILETRIVGDGNFSIFSYDQLEARRKSGLVQKWQADYLMRTREGRAIWVCDISYPWFNEDGAIIGSNGSLRDINERVLAEQKLRSELLGEYGSNVSGGQETSHNFWLRLENEIKRIRRTKDQVALMLLNIRNYELIRNICPEKAWNEISVKIAEVIQKSLRDIDSIARVNEDTFAIIMPGSTRKGALLVAERILETLNRYHFLVSIADMPLQFVSGVASTEDFNDILEAKVLYKMADSELFANLHLENA